MNHDSYSDAYIRDILSRYRSIAMVGASANTSRPSYFAMKYLKEKGFCVIPVNPGQAGKEILGEHVYASLEKIGEHVDIVDIFRSSEAALEVTRKAIEIGAKVVWMQLGVRNDEAARLAEAAGLVGIHAGALANAAAAEAMTSVLIAINKAYKVKASGIRITGLPMSKGRGAAS